MVADVARIAQKAQGSEPQYVMAKMYHSLTIQVGSKTLSDLIIEEAHQGARHIVYIEKCYCNLRSWYFGLIKNMSFLCWTLMMLRGQYDFKKALPSSCSFLASTGVLRFLLKPGNGDQIGLKTFTNHTNILWLVGGSSPKWPPRALWWNGLSDTNLL